MKHRAHCRVVVMRPEISLLVELLARSVYERWKAGEPVPGTPSHRHRNSTIPYLKPQTLLTVSREARQAVRSGANGCKTLQMVAGGRYELYSAYPIRVSAVPASIVATR